jgi:hypothetical protein
MATAKMTAAIDESHIDILGGTAKDRKKLAAFVAQEGAVAAAPFLERVFREGSVAMRAAAAEHLPPAKLAALALAALAALDEAARPTSTGKAKKKAAKLPVKELRALASCLLVAGTDAAIEALLARSDVDFADLDMEPATAAKLAANIAPRLAKLDEAQADALASLLDHMHEHDAPLAFLTAVLDDARLDRTRRVEVADLLVKRGDDASLAALDARAHDADLPPTTVVPVVFARRAPAAAYDALAPHAGDVLWRDAITKGLVALRGSAPNTRPDPRWLARAQEVGDANLIAAVGSDEALAILVTRASALDMTALRALLAAGEARAIPLVEKQLGARGARDEAFAYDVMRALVAKEGADEWLRIIDAISHAAPNDAVAQLARIATPAARAKLMRWASAADENVLDVRARQAIFALGSAGDRDVAPEILRWLARPEGKGVAPMLLNALTFVADRSACAVLEQLAAADAARAGFYRQAIATIAAR